MIESSTQEEAVIYEIVNPSDKMTIEAEDERVAQAATLLLGEGRVGLRNGAGETVLPLFLFGGADEWCRSHFPEGLSSFIGAHRAALAKCLLSLIYVSVEARGAVIAELGSDVEARTRYNDERRTSLTNYWAAASALAEGLLESQGASADEAQSSEEVDGAPTPVKVYKMVVCFVDHDDVGAEQAVAFIEHARLDNHVMPGMVMSVEERVVDWTDDHPLNRSDEEQSDAFARLFAEGTR